MEAHEDQIAGMTGALKWFAGDAEHETRVSEAMAAIMPKRSL